MRVFAILLRVAHTRALVLSFAPVPETQVEFGDPGHRSKTAFLGLQEDSSHNFTRRQSLRSHLAQVLLLSSTCTCGIPIQPPLDCAATARCGACVHIRDRKMPQNGEHIAYTLTRILCNVLQRVRGACLPIDPWVSPFAIVVPVPWPTKRYRLQAVGFRPSTLQCARMFIPCSY